MSSSGHHSDQAADLMEGFAARTGLTSRQAQQRYLWTDAFAVCNFLGLARSTGEQRFLELALRLVDADHAVLGRHRDDDPRQGWISGLDETQGAAHPTRGGLRIGKRLPERDPAAPFDQALEWDRDGQYFHYLTKWMHALDQTTRATGQWEFNVWARELAQTAYDAFTYEPDGTDRLHMYWKMSIDLSYPPVPSMGQHDPLDGHVTYRQLQATASAAPANRQDPQIGDKADRLESAIVRGNLLTTDPLGLGGLLFDIARIVQLRRQGARRDDRLLGQLLGATAEGLARYEGQGDLRRGAEYRLPFREFGLALGLRGVQLIADSDDGKDTSAWLEPLLRYVPLYQEIQSFWQRPAHRQAPTWTGHQDINDVMLATVLAPEGFLVLRKPSAPYARSDRVKATGR